MTTRKSIVSGVVVASAMLAGQAHALPIGVDIISVVDESGSMSTEHAWIDDAILALQTELVAVAAGDSLDAKYGLTGFGGPSGGAPEIYNVGSGQLGSANEFAASANANLNARGSFEDGYEAMSFAFDNYNFTANNALNMILISDEDRDVRSGSTDTRQSMETRFANSQGLLNAVVNCTFTDGQSNRALGIDSDGNAFIADGSGGFTLSAGGQQSGSCAGSTSTDYVDLAIATGGAAWDLNLLRAGGSDAASFTAAFVDIKVGEIVEQQPPEDPTEDPPEDPGNPMPLPGTLYLLAAGAMGLVTRVRVQRRRAS